MSDHELIRKARSLLSQRDPFFATVAYNMEIVREDSVPTTATDGKKLFYNQKFCETLQKPQLVTVLCHEIGHVIFRHHTRRGNRNPFKWNVAGDIVINLMLEKCGYDMEWLGEKGSIPMAFARQFDGLTTEEVYNRLPDMPCPACGESWEDHNQPGQGGKDPQGQDGNQQGNGHKHGKGGHKCKVQCGCVRDGGTTKEEIDKADAAAEVLINQAEQVAKMQGRLPAALERILGTIKEAKINYKDVLPEFIQTSVNYDDIDWLRPVRRMFGAGYYIPKLHNPTIDTVAIGLDTSGSIGPNELNQFFGEIHGVFEQLRPKGLTILDCDAAVHSVKHLTMEDFPIVGYSPKGGGGTDFRPVFEHFEKLDEKPTCLIYLTDLMGTFPDTEPEYPVLWVVYGNFRDKAPWGLTAYIKD